MEFINKLIERHREKVKERNDACDKLVVQIDKALEDARSILSVTEQKVDPNHEMIWKEQNKDILEACKKEKIQYLKRTFHYKELCLKSTALHEVADTMLQNIIQNNTCNELLVQIDIALNEAKAIFASKQKYIFPEVEKEWTYKHSNVLEGIKEYRNYQAAMRYRILCEKQKELSEVKNSMAYKISEQNKRVVEEAYTLIGNVEGRKLDLQQMTCIVKDAYNHLVIAGAGTGKTTTVVGKIKYLLKTEKCLPEDILVLSFTNASALEMKERIAKETGCSIAASTFHKLGLNIITKADGVMPKITQVSLRKFVKEQLIQNMESDVYLNLLSSYLLYDRIVTKSEFEFASQEEYDEYLKLNPPTTVRNEVVKSYGEMDIANFLTQHGIRYIYEYPYEIDTRTEEYGQYHPDFYLPDHKIYIEYFGINREGEVPPYFEAKGTMTATEAYQASMEWKRMTHLENQTTMIECFAYEKFEGVLLDSLKEKLEAVSVTLEEKTSKELWEQAVAGDDSLLDGIIELFETLINLIKSNGYDIATVKRMNESGKNVRANDVILTLVEPIYKAYCQYLSAQGEIDFNDMINLAAKYVAEGKYRNPYKYVIVDEYQDISKARYKLLETLRKSKDYELFCVGDDWQSIYRFAGSDIGFILDFSKYWGATEVSKIETTYRFSQKLIEVSGDFVMKNPMQIQKSIRGKTDSVRFPLGEISGYTEKNAIAFMAKSLEELPENSSVFFIGRYSFDVKMLSDSGIFSCQYNNTTGFVDVRLTTRRDLKMIFLTAHKSKGLQADYIFIVNNKKSRMGFPSKIQDAPILELLLDNCDKYPYAEERRLFYVALTRAKKKVFLITVNKQISEFALELKEQYEQELKKERFECPICGGQLLKKTGPYGMFFGCSNYRVNGCTYKRKSH